MARYSDFDTRRIYEVAERFRDECLQDDRSLLFDGEPVWTSENLQTFHRALVEPTDEGDRKFLARLRDQVESAGQPVTRLVAEALVVYFLFPVNIGGPKKREEVGTALSWGGDSFPEEGPLSKVLDHGIGSAGQWYKGRQGAELKFLIEFTLVWKRLDPDERSKALSDPWRFERHVDSVEGGEGKQLRHMLLHLLFPDHFERIASGSHKSHVCRAFKGLAHGQSGDLDQEMYAIRQRLEQLMPDRELDFYWPPLKSAWLDDAETADEFGPFDIIQHKKQVVLYGPPGTGKTYRAKRLAKQLVRTAALERWGAARYFAESDEVDEAIHKNVHRLQLHPAYGYEDFILGLHIGEGGATEYRLGYLPSLVQAIEEEGDDRLPHILILDEINRTDLSRMLGECFSLLEDRDEEIELPGDESTTTLRMPRDLYVIGTMNLIDQSVEQVDFALRRRFFWVPCPFDDEAMMAAIEKMWQSDPPPNNEWDKVESDFERLKNAAIGLNHQIRSSSLLGPNFEIGHTYFFDVVDFLRGQLRFAVRGRKYYLWGRGGIPRPPIEQLWRLSLRPLLHEYLSGLEASVREKELQRLEDVFFRPKDGEAS